MNHTHQCPHCAENFNVNEPQSQYQVNDLTQLTYCSMECSTAHMFTPNGVALLQDVLSHQDDHVEIVGYIAIECTPETKLNDIEQLANKMCCNPLALSTNCG